MRWDIFCKVIDNHGDFGVCWRLAADLGMRGEKVRLWTDDSSMLVWMAPHGASGVEVLQWSQSAGAEPGDAVVEAFGCELDPAFIAAIAARTRASREQPAWINLEYLSAEPWVERCHGLPSPVSSGPGAGLTKHFFYPGFTPATGGLIRESDLVARQAAFDRAAWLRAQGIGWEGERVLSLFCYEPPGLAAFLARLQHDAQPTTLLVTPGRAAAAVQACLSSDQATGGLRVHWLPLMPQREFDHLLWACDLNLVRGEDSIVRALWAGRPAVWNIYPQADEAHVAKLDTFLDWLGAPPDLRAFHAAWNRGGDPAFPADLQPWQSCVEAARTRLLTLPDLTTQLQSFAARLAGRPAGIGPASESK
jgi:uncharacterized repeat protein (TIGR03837 family)